MRCEGEVGAKTYCLRGAFPPVDFRAVCLVRAILLLVVEDGNVVVLDGGDGCCDGEWS